MLSRWSAHRGYDFMDGQCLPLVMPGGRGVMVVKCVLLDMVGIDRTVSTDRMVSIDRMISSG